MAKKDMGKGVTAPKLSSTTMQHYCNIQGHYDGKPTANVVQGRTKVKSLSNGSKGSKTATKSKAGEQRGKMVQKKHKATKA